VGPTAQVVPQEPPELLVPLRLPAGCLGREEVAAVAAPVVLAVLAVLAVVDLAVAVAVLAAAHTQQVMAGLVGVVGLWFWSFDHAAICSC